MRFQRDSEETFTTAEAAVILTMAGSSSGAMVTKRAVDSVIGKQLFPVGVVKRRRRQRQLTAAGLMIVATEFTLRRELPVMALRKRVYQAMLHPDAAEGRILAGETVTVNVEAPLARTVEALDRFRHLMALVEVDPQIQRGEPVLRGTCVTVATIAALAEGGTPTAEILRHYPSITAKQVEAARVYAKAYPRRGRPSLPAGGKVLAQMSVDDLKAR
jgi:uncharacterized protein (DUF433 family)